MKKSIVAVALALLVGLAGITLMGCAHTNGHDEHGESNGHVHKYTCMHHPEVVRTTAGECPKCGMKLTHVH
jgi:Cu(I)/Ag(I) efflux system membrane fusion protein